MYRVNQNCEEQIERVVLEVEIFVRVYRRLNYIILYLNGDWRIPPRKLPPGKFDLQFHLWTIPPTDNCTYSQFHSWTIPSVDNSTKGNNNANTLE